MQGNLDLDAWQRILAGTPKTDEELYIVQMLCEVRELARQIDFTDAIDQARVEVVTNLPGVVAPRRH
jgi:hypothetical protein